MGLSVFLFCSHPTVSPFVILFRSFAAVQQALTTGTTTCLDLVDTYLERISDHRHLNAFTEVYATESRARAADLDAKRLAGSVPLGRLHGMVIGIKDVLSHADHGLEAGSKILSGFKAQFTATAIARLLAEDAIIIGRQNCDEFAMGSSNETSAYGPVRNAADPTRVPGGSSGGSAVAVQAGLCLASIGSDTGGSVRQPAAFCGVVGLKPTYGRVSRWGLVAYASSFDCIGPIANTPTDAALLLEIMAGPDEFDSTVSDRPVRPYATPQVRSAPARIAYLPESVESEGVAEPVRRATQRAIETLRAAGHTLEPVTFGLLPYLLPTYYVLTTAEASANLARFDGVRYGHRAQTGVTDLTSMYKKSRTEGFGAEVRKRVLLGTFVLSADYYDAYYTKAQQVRRLVQQETDQIFAEYDFLLMPTTPTAAFCLDETTIDPLQMYLADLFTVQANVTGYPAISIPNGTDATGPGPALPIGLQLMAGPFQEQALVTMANTYLALAETTTYS